MACNIGIKDGIEMTSQQYGAAYEKGLDYTIRFLSARGLGYDASQEIAQAAWARGWERGDQLRNPDLVIPWVNSIAMNLYRSSLRGQPTLLRVEEVTLPEPVQINVAAFDVRRILSLCKSSERVILEQRHLQGLAIVEIAKHHGCSKTAVRIRLLRARRALGERIGITSKRTRQPRLLAQTA